MERPETSAVTRRALIFGSAGIAFAAGAPGAAAATSDSSAGAGQGVAAAGAEELTAVSRRLPQRIYGDDRYPVYYRRSMPLSAKRARHPEFPSGTTLLKKGTVRRDGALPLSCDIVLERDVPMKLRDGTTIYTNVFRPTGNGRHPAIVGWSPYGKEAGGQWLDDEPDIRGVVPVSRTSELMRFEGADPAYWVNHGYAVVNPDPRGIGNSEGDATYWGRQLAEDGYDFIEWTAAQTWCTGKVGMSGNSFLTVSQWFIAAERPPHLAAISPWEGMSDLYREHINRGGIPSPLFPELIAETLAGRNLTEDLPLMPVKEQLITPYHQDKAVRFDRITVPAYVVASYTNGVHTHGTFEGYRRIASRHKWLRVHNNQEWIDYYDPESVDDLRRFFDRYLKGVDNGWERTPKVRLAVLDPGGTDVVNRPEKDFPLARTRHARWHLHADGTLQTRGAASASTLSYPIGTDADAAAAASVTFTTTMQRDVELTGYMNLRLWVEADGADDMEIKVTVDKLSADGVKYVGEHKADLTVAGYLRVSHRKLDRRRSTPSEPYLTHDREQLLTPGQIVPVDVGLWPMAMIYRKGQKLRVTVAATGLEQAGAPAPSGPLNPSVILNTYYGAAPLELPADGGTYPPGSSPAKVTLGGSKELPAFMTEQIVSPPPTRNKGRHVLHLGGRYQSYLLVPVTPAR